MSQTIDLTCRVGEMGEPGVHQRKERDPRSAAARAAVLDETAGEECPNCKARPYVRSTWCKHSGYYALIGQCIEIADWEKDYENGEFVGEADAPVAAFYGVPIWAWQWAAALMSVTAMTVIARLYLPLGGTPRMAWTLTQAFGGFLVFAGTYVWIARAALARNRSLEATDVIFSPMLVWVEAIQDFPESFPRLAIGLTGFWATLAAHVLLGVPYGDWIDFSSDPLPERETKKVMPAMSPASSSDKPKTLEEAMDEFADGAGAKQMTSKAKPKKPSASKPKKSVAESEKKPSPVTQELDCLIVGYVRSEQPDDPVRSLVVASAPRSRAPETMSIGILFRVIMPASISVPVESTIPRSTRWLPATTSGWT